MSISQSNIKTISSLRQKKFRQSYHKFTVEGEKMVDELLRQDIYRIDHLYAMADWWTKQGIEPDLDFNVARFSPEPAGGLRHVLASATGTASSKAVTGSLVTEKELQRISQLTTPNQVLAVVELPDTTNAPLPDLSTGWSLYLDGIQSPANLGAILRVADWFGFQHVFGGPGTADLYNAKSIQASMGTFLRVTYREMDLSAILKSQPKLPVFAADLAGDNAFTFSPPPAGVLVIGNEGRGVRPDTRQLITNYLRIPKSPGRQAESLNAAVATGILCGLLSR